MPTPDLPPWTGTAGFDRTRIYRYSLTRTWAADGPRACFVLLNPSTADAHKNDPTIRRCQGYAVAWGAASLEIVNIFALRSTDPAGLRRVEDPIGPRNNGAIRRAIARADTVVAAWGNHGSYLDRSTTVRRLLRDTPAQCLGLTASGEPKHPLYLKSDAGLLAFPSDS